MEQVVLHLTSTHSGFDDRIFYKEASSLAKHYKVVVISAGMHGKIFDMSKNLFDEGYYNGVLELCFFPKSIFFKLNNRYIRFIFRKVFLFFGYYFISKKLLQYKIKPDVIHFHKPELFSIVLKLKHKYKCNLIFDTHEMDIGYVFDKFSFPFNFILSLLTVLKWKKYFKFLDATISVNNIIKAFNVCFNPYILHEVIDNSSVFKADSPSVLNIVNVHAKSNNFDNILLVHEGSLLFNRGFKIMCDLFKDEFFRSKYRLRIVGAIRGKELDYFKYRLKAEPWLKDCIEETGWVDYLDVPKYLKGAHIGLILMEPLYNNLLAGSPNKLFNYVALSIPVLSFDLPATSELINRYGVGVISERNINSLYNSLDILINNYDKFISNINKHKSAFIWETQEKKLIDFYNKKLN